MNPAFCRHAGSHAALLKEMGRDRDAEKNGKLAAAIRRNVRTGPMTGPTTGK